MFLECGKSNISLYDFIGNPCNYCGYVLEWKRGRNLTRFSNHAYRYNANGIRMEKTTASGVVHKYWYEGTLNYDETKRSMIKRGWDILWRKIFW